MHYTKPPVSVPDQIAKLKDRGLLFGDETKAASYLSNISYYRLRAYTYPFQDNHNPEHPFIIQVSFEDIIKLYIFDRHFRLFVLDAIEKIEISIRTQVVYQWAMNHGSHWYLDESLFQNAGKHRSDMDKLRQEVSRSSETFIGHYKAKYTSPPEPPCWMSLEVSSFGMLSLLFKNLRNGSEKKTIAAYYGIKDASILENWMHSFSNIRNICAHHSRLWNRRLTNHIKLPRNTTQPFINSDGILPYKIYASLCCMKYVLDIISPGNGFSRRLKDLMKTCPLVQEKEMGFPTNWQDKAFWHT